MCAGDDRRRRAAFPHERVGGARRDRPNDWSRPESRSNL